MARRYWLIFTGLIVALILPTLILLPFVVLGGLVWRLAKGKRQPSLESAPVDSFPSDSERNDVRDAEIISESEVKKEV